MIFPNLSNWFSNLPYKRKIQTTYIVTMVPIFIIFAIIMGIISYNLLHKRAVDNISIIMDRTISETNTILKECDTQGSYIANDPEIISYLQQMPDSPAISSAQAFIENRLVYLKNNAVSYISDTYLAGENHAIAKTSPYYFKEEDFTSSDWYKTIISNDYDTTWFDASTDSFMVTNAGVKSYITMGRRIENKSTDSILGVALIELNKSVLDSSISYLCRLYEGSSYAFFDSNGIPLLKSTNETRFSDEDLTSLFNQLNNEDTLLPFTGTIRLGKVSYIVSISSLNNGWYLCGIIPDSTLFKGYIPYIFMFLVCVVVLIILTYVISNIMSSSVVRPIHKLIKLMDEAENGNLNVRMNVLFNDEIGNLGNKFNNMLEDIQHYIDKESETQKILLKAQFSLLTAQINPHFIYNTLETINYLSFQNRTAEISTAITALTQLLRTALNKGNDYLSIHDEIAYAENYLKIQIIRYSEKLSYKITYPDEYLSSLMVPKLILQPLVENAIYHGIKHKRTGGTIHIFAEQEEGKVLLKVADTGIGINEAKLKLIRTIIDKPFDENENFSAPGYGLRNVNNRLKLIYGSNYGVTINSTFRKGTEITLTLPITKSEV